VLTSPRVTDTGWHLEVKKLSKPERVNDERLADSILLLIVLCETTHIRSVVRHITGTSTNGGM
jgi:hypothetical protein